LDGTSFNPKPIKLKFTHFRNPKVVEIIGKGGKNSNLIPLRDAKITVVDNGRAEAAGGDAMQGRFQVGARVAVELRLPMVNLLPVDAIGAREKLGFSSDLGF